MWKTLPSPVALRLLPPTSSVENLFITSGKRIEALCKTRSLEACRFLTKQSTYKLLTAFPQLSNTDVSRLPGQHP